MSKRTIITIIIFVLLSIGIIGYQYWFYQIIPSKSEVIVTRGVSSFLESPTEQDGSNYLVRPEQVSRVTEPDSIPPIDDPHYDSIGIADTYLSDTGLGLVLHEDTDPLFYAFQIMSWHEIVNDSINGKNVIVTYCPLCQSSVIYNGGETTFGTSGKVYENNLVMTSKNDDSFWSQLSGVQIMGNQTGMVLQQIPATVMTWDTFKDQYPNGFALNRNTDADRDYTTDPYWEYYENSDIRFPLHTVDPRLELKQSVLGYHEGTAYAKAWSLDQISLETVINDTVKDEEIVIMHDGDYLTTRTFSRVVDNQTLTFKWNGDLLMDEQTGTIWSFEGLGLDGELKGRQLQEVPTITSYWFCWVAQFPGTELYKN